MFVRPRQHDCHNAVITDLGVYTLGRHKKRNSFRGVESGSLTHAGDITAPTRNYLLPEQDPLRWARIGSVRTTLLTLFGLVGAGVVVAAPVSADSAVLAVCNDAFCTPGIAANVVLGAPCNDTSYYVFGTTSWGRLVFCGSPRRYELRYSRAMSMVGVKELNTNCSGRENEMAQAPDGLFLTCVPNNGEAVWVRGDA